MLLILLKFEFARYNAIMLQNIGPFRHGTSEKKILEGLEGEISTPRHFSNSVVKGFRCHRNLSVVYSCKKPHLTCAQKKKKAVLGNSDEVNYVSKEQIWFSV